MVRNIEPTGASVQMTLPREIISRTLPVLERQVDDAIAQRAVLVEMLGGGVQVIDSAGLNWMLGTRSRLETAGIALKIVDASPVMMDIFVATRLDSRFAMQASDAGGRTRGA